MGHMASLGVPLGSTIRTVVGSAYSKSLPTIEISCMSKLPSRLENGGFVGLLHL